MEEKQESRSADLSSQGLNVDRDTLSIEEVDVNCGSGSAIEGGGSHGASKVSCGVRLGEVPVQARRMVERRRRPPRIAASRCPRR